MHAQHSPTIHQKYYVIIGNVEARVMIREQFDKNRSETDSDKIKALIKVAEQAEVIVRKNVVQARQKQPESVTYGTCY